MILATSENEKQYVLPVKWLKTFKFQTYACNSHQAILTTE